MSAQLLDAIDGIITLEISGKIAPTELYENQKKLLQLLQQWGGGSLLIICEQFEGFSSGDWSDLSFKEQADPLIRKMAIIGEAQWETMALAFTAKGQRPFPIQFFPTGHLIEANAWLKSA
ncbi:MAG: STAS/SEC14 domain-containing protein [Akkermansiaceae bacterium]|nr:STAS/SEC14 domain-containing protein [Akkermansiaceae bacterium]